MKWHWVIVMSIIFLVAIGVILIFGKTIFTPSGPVTTVAAPPDFVRRALTWSDIQGDVPKDIYVESSTIYNVLAGAKPTGDETFSFSFSSDKEMVQVLRTYADFASKNGLIRSNANFLNHGAATLYTASTLDLSRVLQVVITKRTSSTSQVDVTYSKKA